MSKLIDKLETELLEARKNRIPLKRNILTFIKGLYELKVKDGATPSNELLLEIIEKTMKSNVATGTEEALGENAVLQEYLPQKLTEEEVSLVAKNLIVAEPNKPMGYYIGQLNKRPEIDGRLAAKVVKEILNT